MTVVTLTDAEKAAVAALAALRLVHSLGAGLGQGHGRGTQHRLSSELTAMAAEYAVSKALGLHWPLDLGRFHLPDVGGYHVRCCQLGGCLILRPDDPDGEPFVLVEADGPTYRLLGWCYPSNVKRPRTKRREDEHVTEAQLQDRLRFLLASLLKLAADLKDEGVSETPRSSQPRPDSSSVSDMPRVTKSNLRPPDAPDWVGP